MLEPVCFKPQNSIYLYASTK